MTHSVAVSTDHSFTVSANRSYLMEWSDILKAYWKIDKILYSGNTKFQKILIAKNPYLGSFLALDGKMQSSEWDEYIYHEALVHPAMLTSYPVKRVLIIGNGEGCVTREVLKYSSVKTIDWVDLDRQVIELCRKNLPYSWKGNDPRVNMIYGDGYKFMEGVAKEKRKYDVILMDLTEYNTKIPLSNRLFSKAAIKLIKSLLSNRGSLVTQCVNVLDNGKVVRGNVPPLVNKAFKYKRTLHFFVPSFLCEYRLVLATDGIDPIKISRDRVRKVIAPFVNTLRYYDDKYHHSIITLPREARLSGRKTF